MNNMTVEQLVVVLLGCIVVCVAWVWVTWIKTKHIHNWRPWKAEQQVWGTPPGKYPQDRRQPMRCTICGELKVVSIVERSDE